MLQDGSLEILDLAINNSKMFPVRKTEGRDPATNPITAFAASTDSIAMVNQRSGSIELRSLDADLQIAEFSGLPSPRISALQFSPEATKLIGAYADGTVVTWDLGSGRFAASSKLSSANVEAVSISRDASMVARITSFRFLSVLTTEDEAVVSRDLGISNVMNATFAGDGKSILLMRNNAAAVLLNSRSLKSIHEVAVKSVTAATFNAEGTFLVLGDAFGSIHIFSLTERRVMARWKAHTGKIVTLEFNRTGDRILSAGADKVLNTWRFNSATPESPAQGDPQK
ncbi:MAG: hypothetical protein IT452_05750 [Planctomycetia bacterium]|nr:hypothetical protein [Planctomycetia bacterium]